MVLAHTNSAMGILLEAFFKVENAHRALYRRSVEISTKDSSVEVRSMGEEQ